MSTAQLGILNRTALTTRPPVLFTHLNFIRS